MPLLDHKYEILRQRPLAAQQTLFEATAPDGTAVSIVWYEFDSPQQELTFERYRRLLRTLRSEGRAAIYDLVSRPGAHYVAWCSGGTPRPDPATKDSQAIRDILAGYGYELQAADLRLDAGRDLKVFGLAFDGRQTALLPVPPRRPAAVDAASRRRLFEQLPGWLPTWLPGVTLALLGLLCLLLGFMRQTSNQVVNVPPLLGADVNEAAQRLYDLGLFVVTEAVPSAADPGEVVGLEPGAGSRLRPGRQIRLRYATPPGRLPLAELPNLVGRRYTNELEQDLLANGLELGRVAHIPADTPQGIILAQSNPKGGLQPGDELDLLVSAGPEAEMTFLPPLLGLELGLAIDLARDAGIHAIEETYVADSRAPVGTVIGQNIAPYSYVPRGTTLRLSVSGSQLEPEPAGRRVPDLILMSEGEAESRLREESFRVGQVETVYLRGLPEGVVAQSPPPAGAPDGNTVDLTVNVHPRDIGNPGVRVTVAEPGPRDVPFEFSIEPGIALGRAAVYATTLSGDSQLVTRQSVQGGDTLEGVWTTREPGPVSFELLLNGFPYKELRVNP